MSEDETGDALLQFMEQVAPLIAMITVVRAQFIAQGWEPGNAEAAAVELFRLGNRGRTS